MHLEVRHRIYTVVFRDYLNIYNFVILHSLASQCFIFFTRPQPFKMKILIQLF